MSRIDALIQEFVINLRQAIAQEAAEAFAIAGGGGAGSVGNGRRKPGPKPRSSVSAVASVQRKGGKRTTEEIAAQGATILGYLKKNPASGAEALGAALGMSTAEIALPMAKLIADKAVKFVGQKRGRKYSVR
jgi:predicted HTH transcriptional regulator